MFRVPVLIFLLLLWAPAQSQDVSAPIHVGQKEMQSQIVHTVPPLYPPLARQARIQGTVMLKAIIGKSGTVENVQLVSGHPMLAPAAIEAVKQWQYKPVQVNGEPVEVSTEVQVNFVLDGEPPPTDNAQLADDPCRSAKVGGDNATPSYARVDESTMRARRTQRIDPVYPPQAIDQRIEGRVILKVCVDASGDVKKVQLLSGHPMLTSAAIDAVRQWKYQPYVLNDAPTAAESLVTISFTLPRPGESEGTVADTPVVGSDGPGSPPKPRRIRVSSGVAEGLIRSKVNPHYPPEARAQHIQGAVVLKARIDEEGNVIDLEPISGDPALTGAAIEAAQQWKYRPYLLNGEPVEVETQIRINFTLAP